MMATLNANIEQEDYSIHPGEYDLVVELVKPKIPADQLQIRHPVRD